MKSNIILLLLAGVMLLSSCQKNQETYSYTFANNSTVPLNLVIYKTIDDYVNSVNPFIQYNVAAGDSVHVLSSKLGTGNTYYIDYFSSDYVQSNWVDSNNRIPPYDNSLSTTANSMYYRMQTYPDYSRLLCINGNNVKTTWRVVSGIRYLSENADDTGVQFNQLSPLLQNITMTISKSHRLDFYYHPTYGDYANTDQILDVPWIVKTPNTYAAGNTIETLYVRSPYDRDFQTYGTITYSLNKPFGTPGAGVNDTLTLNIFTPGDSYLRGTFQLVKTNNN